VPGQPSGTTVEYYLRAEGLKGGVNLTQSLPAQQPETHPLSYTVGAPQPSAVTGLKVPETDGPLIGFSLQNIDATQQVKRRFVFNRTEAVHQWYHPSGVLSRDSIGPAFDPAERITHVQLGQGPFKVISVQALAGFDFDAHHVLVATVHLSYGRDPDGPGPLRTADITLTRERPQGRVQFNADAAGTLEYSYDVEFTYDPDRVVGGDGKSIRSRTFAGVTARSITVDLDTHSPLFGVQILPGHLSLGEQLVSQVQVRVAPTRDTPGSTVVLRGNGDRDVRYVLPADPATRRIYVRQETFFKDDSSVQERTDFADHELVVNEPTDAILRMTPH